MKRFVTSILFILFLSSLIFAGGQSQGPEASQGFTQRAPEEYQGTITVWSFTDEPEYLIRRFNEKYPNVTVEFTHTPGGQNYIARVNAAITAGNLPDVFSAEISFLKRWTDARNVWANLSQGPFNAEANIGNTIPYVADLGRDQSGALRALSFQATPGGVYYRRSLARTYLGTEDPARVQALWPNLDAFLRVAANVRDRSNGNVHLFSSWWDLRWFFLNSRSQPWVVDNELVIDPLILEYFDLAKRIREENLSGNALPGTPAWTSFMQEERVIAYILPTWGQQLSIRPRVEPEGTPATFTGNWAVTEGPVPYFWGGTWWGVSETSQNKELAWLFLNFLVFDEEFLESYARERGDFVSNVNVIERMQEGFSDSFLGGQNTYGFWADAALNIDPSLTTRYDQDMEQFLRAAISLYVDGEATFEEALNKFREDVTSAFPTIRVR